MIKSLIQPATGNPGCGMLLQLSHEALSNYLVVDHVTLSKFDASSFSRKEKNRTPSGQENEGVNANHPVYPSVSQEIAPRYRIVALLLVKISLIGIF